MPDESVRGEPFWALMELKESIVTGSYYTYLDADKPILPLFYSKMAAEEFLSALSDGVQYCVRGISQYQFRVLLSLGKMHDLRFAVSCGPFKAADVGRPFFVPAEPEVLSAYYLDE